MKKKRKNTFTIIFIIISIAIIVTGGIAAYLTDTDQATNVFTVGKIKISLTEPNWDQLSGQNILPGDEISKDPQIENIGKNSAYVYMKVEQPLVELPSGTFGPLFDYNINKGWTLLGDNSSVNCPTRTSVYYYNTALEKNTSTNTLFDNVTVNDFNQDEMPDSININVTGYAIQSNNLPDGTTIQNAYNTYFENSGISECSSISRIYRWGRQYLSKGTNISSLTEGRDYVLYKSQLPNMDSRASTFYLKHDVSNNEITNSYVCFKVTSAMKNNHPAMTVGEYCLLGESGETTYTSNKEILTTAFGSENCTENNSIYDCSTDELWIYAGLNGKVQVYNYSGFCSVFEDNSSICDNDYNL